MSSQLFRFLQSQPPQQKVNIPHLPSDLRFLGFQIAQSLEKCNKSHESSIANKLVLNLKALPSNECGKKVVFKNSCILTAQQHHPKHNIEVESQLVNSPNVWGHSTPINLIELPEVTISMECSCHFEGSKFGDILSTKCLTSWKWQMREKVR